MDKKEVLLKGKNILINVAIIVSIILCLWAIGTIIFHDISAMITGYEEIAIEYVEDDDWMGIPHQVVSKTVKRKIPFEEAFGEFIENVCILIVSSAFLLVVPDQKTRKNQY